MLKKLAQHKIKAGYARCTVYALLFIGFGGFLFQLGHFVEHIMQAVVWLAGHQDKPYMTHVGMWLVHTLGQSFFPDATMQRQGFLGMELLHLIGNTVFLIGISALLFFVRTRMMCTAFFIQAFHFYEHLCLTLSAIMINKSIGMSTLYGADMTQWAYTAYRVWWHFFFNAIPTVLVLLVLYTLYRKYKNLT